MADNEDINSSDDLFEHAVGENVELESLVDDQNIDAGLLSSLEYTDENAEFEDVEDSLSDISEEKLAELQSMFDMLNESEALISLNNAPTQPDLDVEIGDALESDLQEENDIDIFQDDVSFVGDVAIFDTEKRETIEEKTQREAQEKADKEEKEEKMFSVKKFLGKFTKMQKIIAASIFAVICVFGVVFAATYLYDDVAKNVYVLEQPTYNANDSDYIFVDQTYLFDNSPIDIYKILISPKSTVVYFKHFVDVYQYNVNLTDENGKVYYLDLTSLQNKSETTKKSRRTELFFQPLDANIKEFSLNISNPKTKAKLEIDYLMKKPLRQTPIEFISGENNNVTVNNKLLISVLDSNFSSASSDINFNITSSGVDSSVQFVYDEKETAFKLTEAGKSLKLNGIEYFNFPNHDGTPKDQTTLVGRANFAPLKSLQSKATIIFDNLFEVYKLDKKIPSQTIMNFGEEAATIIDIGHYSLFIERAQRSKNQFVVVLHGEDNLLLKPAPNISEIDNVGKMEKVVNIRNISEEDLLFNRIETKLDIKLLAKTETGAQLQIPGQVMSKQIGTDVLFDGSAYGDQLSEIPLENIEVLIENVKFKVPEARVEIDLKTLSEIQNPTSRSIVNTIESAFSQRLDYKAGKITKQEIKSISSEILDSGAVMKLYEPIANGQDAKYSAQVVAFNYNNEFVEAIVKEIWQADDNSNASDFLMTHKIIVKPNSQTWEIIADVIVNED